MSWNAVAVAPIVLSGMLLVSGAAKWRDQASTASAIRLLRLPTFLHGAWVTKALPLGEVALALALFSPWLGLARLAAAAAVVLFVTYFVIVARAMGFRPRPSCGCFGRIGDQRINGLTLTRNGIFVALAVILGWLTLRGETVPQVLGHFADRDWGWLLAGIVLAASTWLVFGTKGVDLTRRHAHAAPGADSAAAAGVVGASAGADATAEDTELDYIRTEVPEVLLLSPDGSPRTLRELSAQRAQLLVMADCFCGPTFAARSLLDEHAPDLSLIDTHFVLSLPQPSETDHGLGEDVWYDHKKLAWRALEVPASPAAVLLGADGLLAGGPVNGVEAIRDFLGEIREALADAPEPPSEESPAEEIVG